MATHVQKNDVFKVLKLNMAIKGYNILSECQKDAPCIIDEILKRKQQEFVNESRKKSKVGVNTDDFTLVQEILESSGEFENDFNRLEELTANELKQMCKDYGLSQNGHKLDLVQRIADYLHDQRGFNTRISSINNSYRSSVKRIECGESAILKENEVSLLNKLIEEEGKVNDEKHEEKVSKNDSITEEPPQKHIQSPSPISRPVHKAIPVSKNQDIQIESPIVEKPLKSVKPKLNMEEIESNIEETVDECELKRKIKLEMEKRKPIENKYKETNTSKTYTVSKTPLTPKPNLKNPIISKLKNSAVISKPSPINASNVNNNNITKQEKTIQLVHPISTPILNHKCSKVFINSNNNNNQQKENKKKENPNNKKTNNDENKENKEDNCVKKNTTDNIDKKKYNSNNNNKSNQEDWTSGEQLQKQLKYQYDHYIDLECIFGTVKMCKLDSIFYISEILLIAIFPNCQKTLRGSSGDWRNDGLTKEEREEYKREIELERLL